MSGAIGMIVASMSTWSGEHALDVHGMDNVSERLLEHERRIARGRSVMRGRTPVPASRSTCSAARRVAASTPPMRHPITIAMRIEGEAQVFVPLDDVTDERGHRERFRTARRSSFDRARRQAAMTDVPNRIHNRISPCTPSRIHIHSTPLCGMYLIIGSKLLTSTIGNA